MMGDLSSCRDQKFQSENVKLKLWLKFVGDAKPFGSAGKPIAELSINLRCRWTLLELTQICQFEVQFVKSFSCWLFRLLLALQLSPKEVKKYMLLLCQGYRANLRANIN